MESFTEQQLKQIGRWLTAIVIVKFDINEGQLVEFAIPFTNRLSQQEQKQIAMASFPDSNSFEGTQGSLKYIFRITANKMDNFGFTCFKQKKDKSLFRGYFQKSLVIISPNPFISFFSSLAQFIVFKTFSNQVTLQSELKKILRQIVEWPDPISNTIQEVKVLDYKIKAQLPNKQNCLDFRRSLKNILQQNNHQISSGYFQDALIYDPFKNIIRLLWSIWEIVLLNKPLLVISENPHLASQAILSAVGLISPLQYNSIYKPYITVYDKQVQQIQEKLDKKQSVHTIMGGTNPVFLKIMKKLQHIINLEDSYSKNKKNLKTIVECDNQFVKQLLNPHNEQTVKINQSLIRKNFRKLTEQFIDKFESYFLLQKNDLKIFNKLQFLKFLKTQYFEFGECLQSKSNILKLYEEFCQTANFAKYISARNVIRINNN